MTSKQALENLYQGALNPVNCVYATFITGASEKITDDYNVVKNDLEILKIIKNKGVDVGYLNTCKTLNEYNCVCLDNVNEKLTEEEYDLLRDWLLENGKELEIK